MRPDQTLCDDVLALIPLHVGGDLEPEWTERVARHLERCDSCTAELERARAARAPFAMLRAEADGWSAVDVWDGVRSELAREGLLAPSSPLPAAPRRVTRAPLVPLGRLAAAAGILALGLWAAFAGETPPNAGSPGPGPVSLEGAGSEAPVIRAMPVSTGGLAGTVGDDPIEPMAGGLRRAQPGEERLRDLSRPFPEGSPILQLPFTGRTRRGAPVGGGGLR